MKNKSLYLYLTAALMLTSCAESPQNHLDDSQLETQEITSVNANNAKDFLKQSLAKFKKGYYLDSKIQQTIYEPSTPTDKEVSLSVVETYVIDDKFSFKLYNPNPNHDKSSLGAFDTFYKGEDGLTYSARINLNNEVAKRKVLHPTGNGIFNYVQEGFGNMFKDLEVEDFTQVSSFDYSINLSKVKKPNLKQTIASSLYGGPGLKAKTFSLKLTPDAKVSVKSTFETFQGKQLNYDYTIEAKLSPLNPSDFPDRNVLYPEVKDDLFENKINSLKQYNFTLTQQDFDLNDKLLKESKLLINPDKFYSSTIDTIGRPLNVGMYKDQDNYYSVVKQDNGEYILGEQVDEQIYSYYLPSFKISRNVFDKIGENIYQLKPQIDSDSTPFSRYETNADELNKTTIEFKENTIEVKNSFGQFYTKIVYSNIGTTDVGYSKDSVIKTEINLTSWDQVFSTSQIEKLNSFFDNDLSFVPFPSMLKDASSFALGLNEANGILQIVYNSAAMPSKANDIIAYNELLSQAGWIKQDTSTDEKGYYKINKNDVSYKVTVESDGANLYISFFK